MRALSLKTNFENEFNYDETFEQHLNEFKDITNVAIKVNEDKKFYISVPWDGEDVYTNPLQKTNFEEDVFTIEIGIDK